MEEKRARRRRDKQRMKARAVRVYGRHDHPGYWGWPGAVRPDPRRHASLADHMAHCSRMCCGNPRRWFGEATMQERRFDCEEVE